MSMANVSLVGNLVKPPEQTCFASGRVKTTMVVAINTPNRQSKGSDRTTDNTDFYRVEAWGKLADLTHKYLAKGNQVGVSGRLIMDHWVDKQGRSRITPIVEATQIALPPRLRAVGSDIDSPETEAAATNPISGELVFSEPDETALPFDAEDEEPTEPVTATRAAKRAVNR